MLQMLKHEALCIHVLYTAPEQEEEAKRIKEKDMLQVQTVWTLHWSMPTKVGGAASTKPVRPVLAVAVPMCISSAIKLLKQATRPRRDK